MRCSGRRPAAAVGRAAVAGWLVAGTLQTTLFQEAVEPGMLGRVFGLKRSLEQVTWPVSAVLTGLLTPALMGASWPGEGRSAWAPWRWRQGSRPCCGELRRAVRRLP